MGIIFKLLSVVWQSVVIFWWFMLRYFMMNILLIYKWFRENYSKKLKMGYQISVYMHVWCIFIFTFMNIWSLSLAKYKQVYLPGYHNCTPHYLGHILLVISKHSNGTFYWVSLFINKYIFVLFETLYLISLISSLQIHFTDNFWRNHCSVSFVLLNINRKF